MNQHQQSAGSASAPTSRRPLTLDPTGGRKKLALFGFRRGLTHFPELEGGVELVSGRQQEDGVVDPRVQRWLRLKAPLEPGAEDRKKESQ